MNNYCNCRSWGAATRTKGPLHSDPGLAPPGVGPPVPKPSALGDPPPLGPQQMPPRTLSPALTARRGPAHVGAAARYDEYIHQ